MNDFLADLKRHHPSQADYELAQRHAPRIRFDQREPFLPLAVGYTVFRETAASPSFPRSIQLPAGAQCAIEYAVWWDWDIQHLYELEHIWVYLDASERVIAAEASWHGGYNPMQTAAGALPLDDGRVMLFSEPGKHAFAADIDTLRKREKITRYSCGAHAGKAGVHVTPLFDDIITTRTPLNNQLAHTYLERNVFQPTYEFSQLFVLESVPLVPWANLSAWIPGRVAWWLDELQKTIPPQQRRVLRIAHRGASAYAQEGSKAALEKAAAMGADLVELDVRYTVDSVPVIAHDANLQRIFGVDARVNNLTAEALRAITPETHQPILTFDEAVALCASMGLGLYLDIKEINLDVLGAMLASLERHSMFNAAVFASFNPSIVADIHAHDARTVTAILFASTNVQPVALAQSVGATYVHPCWEREANPSELLTSDWLDKVYAAGLGVICWHEERPAEIRALQARGVQGICSDQPDLLLPDTTR
ncbi:MAG: hypothetical protein K8L99_06070 [Anaerolineae bacterium]|nr:hypothetical protein [Anaerolineae bacterium]